MELQNLSFATPLSEEEMILNNGGFVVTLLAIGAGAGALLACYELGKATGEFIKSL